MVEEDCPCVAQESTLRLSSDNDADKSQCRSNFFSPQRVVVAIGPPSVLLAPKGTDGSTKISAAAAVSASVQKRILEQNNGEK